MGLVSQSVSQSISQSVSQSVRYLVSYFLVGTVSKFLMEALPTPNKSQTEPLGWCADVSVKNETSESS